jgi:hypothetical protein
MNILLKKFDTLFATLQSFQMLYEESSKDLADDLMVDMDFLNETDKKKIVNELGTLFHSFLYKIFHEILLDLTIRHIVTQMNQACGGLDSINIQYRPL